MKMVAAALALVILTAAEGTHARPFAAASTGSLSPCQDGCQPMGLFDDWQDSGKGWVDQMQFVVADIGAGPGCWLCGVEQHELITANPTGREVAFAGHTTQGARTVHARIFDPSD